MIIVVLVVACIVVIGLILMCRSKHSEGLSSGSKPLVHATLPDWGCSLMSDIQMYWALYLSRVLGLFKSNFNLKVSFVPNSDCITSVVIYPNGPAGKSSSVWNEPLNNYHDVTLAAGAVSRALGVMIDPDKYRPLIVAKLPTACGQPGSITATSTQRCMAQVMAQLQKGTADFGYDYHQTTYWDKTGKDCTISFTVYPSGRGSTPIKFENEMPFCYAEGVIQKAYKMINLPGSAWKHQKDN